LKIPLSERKINILIQNLSALNWRGSESSLFFSGSQLHFVGLQVTSVTAGTVQLIHQRNHGQKVNPVDVAQVAVGGVGLTASFLSYLGIENTIRGEMQRPLREFYRVQDNAGVITGATYVRP
jgi:hypothetical protein